MMYCDNILAIKLSKNLVIHGRSKYINVIFYFLRDLVMDCILKAIHHSIQQEVANILTKPLKLDTFLRMRNLWGVHEYPGIN